MGATTKTVDLSNIKEGGGSFATRRVPAGDYAAKIVKVEDAESKKDGEFQYLFTIKLKKYSQNSYPYYCKLQENQLWKLRNLLIAAGLNVPKARVKVDPNKAVGREIGVTMEDDEYDGKDKSTIAAVFPVAELAGGDDDTETSDEEFDEGVDDSTDDEPAEEKPKKKKDKGGKKKKKGSEENLEEIDISDM